MHAMNDRINMRRLGGLAKVMPITYLVFVAGYLAIIGFPLATGFWTKDKIIEAALDKGGTSGWILGLTAVLGAGITAFYMTRALVMTFHGERRWEEDVHPHESPRIMTWPMIVLGVLSLVGGYLLIYGGGLQHWLTRALVYVDSKGVDGVVNGLAASLGGASGRLRKLQTGFVRSYALSMMAGAVAVVAV